MKRCPQCNRIATDNLLAFCRVDGVRLVQDSGSLMDSETVALLPDTPTYASLGVVMKWEVFDWGRKRDQLAEKDKTIEQARNELHEAESLVLIDVGDKFRKLQQTRQALVVAQLSQETSREALRVNTNKYSLTAALLSDALQSQASLADANHGYQQAILGYWTAKAELEKAIGEGK